MRFERWVYVVPLRLRSLFRRRRVEEELDEELQYHLERQIERLVADGMRPREARQRAMRALGGVEQRKEECRDWRGVALVDHVRRDTVHACRTLRRDLGFTLGAASILALGIGANAAMLTIVNDILLRPLPYGQPDRLVAIREVVPQVGDRLLPVNERHYTEWRECECFEDVALSDTFAEVNLTGGGEPERVPFARVTPNTFALLGAQAQVGRAFLPGEGRAGEDAVVVISDGLWRRRFSGNPDVVGTTIGVNGREATIVGVLWPGFRHFDRDGVAPDGRVDVYAPWIVAPEDWVGWAGNFNYAGLGRLRPGISVEAATRELEAIQAVIAERFPARWAGFDLHARLIPLRERLTGRSRAGLLLLLGAVGAAFLVACVNIANLMLVRATARRRESALRAALGASRAAIVGGVLIESAVLSLGGAAAGVGLALSVLRVFASIAPPGLPRADEVQADWTVVAVAALGAVAASLAFGLLPALRSTRVDPQEALRTEGRSVTDARGRLRQALVSLEVGLSACLLVVAGLLLTSFLRLEAVDRGFDSTNLLTAEITLPSLRYGPAGRFGEDNAHQRFHEALIERLESAPDIVAAGVTSMLPLRGNNWGEGAVPEGGQPGTISTNGMEYRWVSPNYWKAMGIPLLAGRSIARQDRPQRVAVVSQRTARLLWPDEIAVGKRFYRAGNPKELYEVVGIVPDVHTTELASDPIALVYLPLWLSGAPVSSIAVRTRGAPTAVTAVLREAVASLDAEVPIANVRTMREIDRASVGERRFQMRLTVAFALASLLVAALGTYSVLAYSVSQRRREIAIRLALGAWQGTVTAMVFQQGLRPVLVGLLIGVAGALALGRIVSGLLFEVSPTDPTTLGIVIAVTLVAAALASWIPARRAARISLPRALRDE